MEVRPVGLVDRLWVAGVVRAADPPLRDAPGLERLLPREQEGGP